MQVKIIRDFRCAADAGGVNFRDLRAGAMDDVRDDLAPGLLAAGYVAAVEDEPAPPKPAPKKSDPEVRLFTKGETVKVAARAEPRAAGK